MTYPNQYPTAGPAKFTDESDKWLSILSHALIVVVGFIGPLITYLISKGKPGRAEENAKEALNFSLTMSLAILAFNIVAAVATLVSFGFLSFLFGLASLPGLLIVVFGIVGAVKCYQDGYYRYPDILTLRMVK